MTTHTTPAASEAWKAGNLEGWTGKSGKHLIPKHLHAEYEKGKAQGEADKYRLTQRSGR